MAERTEQDRADIRIVAQEMILNAIDGTIQWEDYPELPEWAFEEALADVNSIAAGAIGIPTNRVYREAYHRLEVQAVNDETAANP